MSMKTVNLGLKNMCFRLQPEAKKLQTGNNRKLIIILIIYFCIMKYYVILPNNS